MWMDGGIAFMREKVMAQLFFVEHHFSQPGMLDDNFRSCTASGNREWLLQ